MKPFLALMILRSPSNSKSSAIFNSTLLERTRKPDACLKHSFANLDVEPNSNLLLHGALMLIVLCAG